MIWVSAPTKSENEGKLHSSKQETGSFYINPPHRNASEIKNWSTKDTLTFEFKLRDSEPLKVSFCVLWSASTCFEYSFEPFQRSP